MEPCADQNSDCDDYASNDVVIDNLTGLMWTRDGNLPDEAPTLTDAIGYITDMNGALGLCGFTDWHLPNVNEIQNLVNVAGDTDSWLNDQGFVNNVKSRYWSSTTYATATRNVLYIALGDDTPIKYQPDWYTGYVWPVRVASTAPAPTCRTGQTMIFYTGDDGDIQAGVEWPDPRFTITYCDSTGPCEDQGSDCDGKSSTDVVTDNLTGLMWTRNANLLNAKRTWEPVLDFANNLDLGGYTDWRLPNIHELRSLIDYSNYDPALLSLHPFISVSTGINNAIYWSSTVYKLATTYAWYINITNGLTNGSLKTTSELYVWPVRAGVIIVSDTIPPETSIVSGPSGTITSNDVTFTYSGTDNVTATANLVYSYKLEDYDSQWSSYTTATSQDYDDLPDGSYNFFVKAKDEAGNVDSTPASRSFTVVIAPGWSSSQSGYFLGVDRTPAVGDLNGDGTSDLCILHTDDPQKISALNGKDGSTLWTYTTTEGIVLTTPHVSDLDDNGTVEVSTGMTFTANQTFPPEVIVLKAESSSQAGEVLATWSAGSQKVEGSGIAPYFVKDVNGYKDNFKEILVGTSYAMGTAYSLKFSTDTLSHLWAYADGTSFAHYPRHARDIDGDGIKEIAILCGVTTKYVSLNRGDTGASLWRKPVYAGWFQGRIIDLGKGQYAVATTVKKTSEQDKLYMRLYDADNGDSILDKTFDFVYTGWYAYGDIDNDGAEEFIAVQDNGSVAAYDIDINGSGGAPASIDLKWSISLNATCLHSYNLMAGPAPEIIVGTTDAKIVVLSGSGGNMAEFTTEGPVVQAAAADINNDGMAEIIAAADKLHVFSLTMIGDEALPWLFLLLGN